MENLEQALGELAADCREQLSRETRGARGRRTAEAALWEARRCLFRGEREAAAVLLAEGRRALSGEDRR